LESLETFLSLSKCALTTRRILKERDFYLPNQKLDKILISPLILREGVYKLLKEFAQEISEIMVDCGSFLVQQGRIEYSELLKLIPEIYAKIEEARWYVLPDFIPVSSDDEISVDKKVNLTIKNALKFTEIYKSSHSFRLIPVVQGYRYEQFERCFELYSTLPIKRVGFGSFVTSGPSHGINSMSYSTIERLKNIISLANRYDLQVHVFGISSPIQLLLCGLFGITSVDSSAWNRIAGYGLIYLPFLRSFYVSAQGRKSTLFDIKKLKKICDSGWPDFVFISEQPIVKSMYVRSLHNWTVLRYMSNRISAPKNQDKIYIKKYSPRNFLLLEYALNCIKKSTIIRKATKSDTSAIMALAKAHIWELGYIRRTEIEEAIKRNHVIVAEALDKVVGFQEFRHLKRKPQTTLYHKAVSQRFRRFGIGTNLVDFVVDEAISLGQKKLIVKCAQGLEANKFHLKYGFKLKRIEEGKQRPINVYEMNLY